MLIPVVHGFLPLGSVLYDFTLQPHCFVTVDMNITLIMPEEEHSVFFTLTVAMSARTHSVQHSVHLRLGVCWLTALEALAGKSVQCWAGAVRAFTRKARCVHNGQGRRQSGDCFSSISTLFHHYSRPLRKRISHNWLSKTLMKYRDGKTRSSI